MYPLEPERAREEMVGVWLERDPHPTWAKLADGFEHAGQRALARRIRETYNCTCTYMHTGPACTLAVCRVHNRAWRKNACTRTAAHLR